MRLETSNLAYRRTAVSINENYKISSKGVIWGHVTHFWNFGTPHISATVEDRNFKFGKEMDGGEYWWKKV